MVKLLIADDNEEFRLALAEQLQSEFHVFSCGTGRQALTLLRQETPELLVLDLMLSELDGLTLLELAAQEQLFPIVLGITPLVTDYVRDCAQRLGIRYMMRSPCALEAVVSRIRDLTQKHTLSKDPQKVIKDIFSSLSISTTLDGSAYSSICMTRMLKTPKLAVTKDLYPSIAKAFGQRQKNVERSIRHAIETGWDHGDRDLWLYYFPTAKERPSNSVFLIRMTEELRLRLE